MSSPKGQRADYKYVWARPIRHTQYCKYISHDLEEQAQNINIYINNYTQILYEASHLSVSVSVSVPVSVYCKAKLTK